MRRIVFYCRVSTDNQEKSETIDNQKRDLYKVYDKADVIKIYEDNPGSGADPDRVGLTELRKDAQKKMFDVIALWASDRLARDLKLSLILRDEFKELGIAVEIMGKEREDSDMGKFMGVIEGAIDEMERARIKRRFISGRDRRLAEGKLIGCYPPYGYRHIKRNKETGTDASFEINEQEAVIVRKIFNYYIKCESIFLTAKHLIKEGIKGRGKGRLEPGFMQTSSVSKILKRESYIGNHYFGKSSPCIAKFHIYKTRKYRYTGRKTNPKSEWKKVSIPAIIDEETFYKVQDILQKRAKHRLEMSKYQFLCQGLIKCVQCGRSYGGRCQAQHYLFYRCPQALNSNLNMPACRSRTMGGNKLDNAVWAYVSSMINDFEKVKSAVKDLKKKRENDKSANKNSRDNLLVEKNNLKIKRGKLFELYSEMGKAMSTSAKEDMDLKLKEIDEKEKMIDKQISELESDMKEIKNSEALEAEIEKTCKLYQQKIDNPPFELKKYIVFKWVEEININDDGSLKIRVRIPEGDAAWARKEDIVYVTNEGLSSVTALNIGLKFEEVIMP